MMTTKDLRLTSRMKEVAECLINGMKEQEISDHLFISIYTVKYHKENLFQELGVHSVSQLTSYFLTKDLIRKSDDGKLYLDG